MIKSFGFLLASFFSLSSFAQPLELADATMQCTVDSGDTFFIFGNQKRVVVYSAWNKKEIELKELTFRTYRCPYCYFFMGKDEATGIAFKGYTDSMFNEETYQFVPSLKIENQRPAVCIINSLRKAKHQRSEKKTVRNINGG